jgi:hypothetical protein
MQPIRLIAVSALAIFALGAIGGTTAQAAEGPFYKTCAKKENPCAAPKRLGAGETLTPTAEATKTLVMESIEAGVTIECKKLKLEKATINGSAVGNAGTGIATSVFEECTQKGNGAEPACKVVGKTITTVPLVTTLAKENKTAVKGEKLFGSVRPKEGSIFVNLKFEGTCKLATAAIELGPGAKLGAAGIVDNEAQEQLKLEENETLGEAGLAESPKTLIKTVFIEEGKAVTEVKEKLTFAGLPINRFEGHGKGTVAKADVGVFSK